MKTGMMLKTLGLAACLAHAAPGARIERATVGIAMEEDGVPGKVSFRLTSPGLQRFLAAKYFLDHALKSSGASFTFKFTGGEDAATFAVTTQWKIAPTLKRETLNCFGAWYGKLGFRDGTNLDRLFLAPAAGERKKEQLESIAPFGEKFAAFVAANKDCRRKASGTAAPKFLSFDDPYWELQDYPEVKRDRDIASSYVASFEALFGGVVKPERRRMVKALHGAWMVRLESAFESIVRLGMKSEAAFDADRLFDRLRRGEMKTPAQLALGVFLGCNDGDRGLETFIRNRNLSRMAPAAWLADVTLQRCRGKEAVIVNPACGERPESFFEWWKLETPTGNAHFLMPKASHFSELEDGFLMGLLPPLAALPIEREGK